MHACMHNTYAFVHTKERGRCWAWVEDQMQASHPLPAELLFLQALSVHWGRGKEEEARFVGHQATVPWETDVQATT